MTGEIVLPDNVLEYNFLRLNIHLAHCAEYPPLEEMGVPHCLCFCNDICFVRAAGEIELYTPAVQFFHQQLCIFDLEVAGLQFAPVQLIYSRLHSIEQFHIEDVLVAVLIQYFVG